MKHTQFAMLRRTCGAWLLSAAAPLAAQAPAPASAPPAVAAADQPTAPNADDIGYLFGLTFGEQVHTIGSDQVKLDSLTRGLKDALQGRKSTPAEKQQVQEFVRTAMATAITRNQGAARDFLMRNGKESGVITTASGLQYKVLLPGDRKASAPAPTDTVTVQYRGKLLDGTEFDSTYERGAPETFPVNGVIRGWQEALVLMRPGAKWKLFVPPELGYGANPRPSIPGGSLLIFDVELMSVKSNAPPPAPPQTGSKPAPKSNQPR